MSGPEVLRVAARYAHLRGPQLREALAAHGLSPLDLFRARLGERDRQAR